MNSYSETTLVADYKAQAKRLRAKLRESGTVVSHSEALEMIASQHGARDWNTLSARSLRNEPPVLAVGDRVSGRYLSQPFIGRVLGLRQINGGQLRITLHFDEAVDVVTFDSFSAFRQRVTAEIGKDGRSLRKTSDGVPQMVLDLE
jgi:glyoxalase superfamily protein